MLKSLATGLPLSFVGERARTGLVCAFLGLVFVGGIGFANPIHDAAHDTRHAFTFPCH
jgi:cobalt transporter subunit CbtB